MVERREKRAAIIGGGLGGLSAAIYLRLAAFDVAIYEANERLGGRANLIERDGFRFDTGPSLLNYPWIFEQLFQAAGRKMNDYIKLLPVNPSVTFHWPDGTRFTLSSDLQKFLEECERVEPRVAPSVLAYLRESEEKYRISFSKLINRNIDMPAKWLGSLSLSELRRIGIWRSLDSELGRFFKSRYIREALGSYGMYLGGSPYQLPGTFTILPYGELAYGLWLPVGGIYGLIEGIEKLARELGVLIHTNSRVGKIPTEGGRVKGIELSDGRFCESSIVVSNVDVPTTNTELLKTENGLSERLRLRATKTRMTPGVVTFYWGIRGKVDGIGHHTIYLPENYRAAFDDLFLLKQIPRDLPFYVSVPSATIPDVAPAGDTAMFVLAPTPLLSELSDINWPQVLQQLKSQILARLLKHGVEISPERIYVEEVYTPHDWRERFGLYDGSAFGAAHTFLQIGPFRHRNFSREIDGLYYVGASTTPGTGLPMVVMSGRLTVERILSHVR